MPLEIDKDNVKRINGDIQKRKTFSKKLRDEIAAKTNHRCAYCGEVLGNRFYIDHVKSVYSGGGNELSNLKASCFSCNSFKHAMTLEQFRNEMSKQANRAFAYSRNYRMALKYKLIKPDRDHIIFYFEEIEKSEEV